MKRLGIGLKTDNEEEKVNMFSGGESGDMRKQPDS